jgi:DNA invertase Pin-like site-specific DNA recombinase
VSRSVVPSSPSQGVAYIRVSKEEQQLGPEAQRAAIEAWAAAEGVEIVAWHIDHGLSGGLELDDRPALVQAIGELRARRLSVLVVAKRDRIARDVYVAAVVERAVEKIGGRVVCADGAGNGDTPADAFMRRILDAAAEYERALIRMRTKAALRAKRARGERAGQVPFGFRLADDGRGLVDEPKERAVLERVRVLAAAGVTLRQMVASLAAEGLTSRAGRPFSRGSVENLLRIVRRPAA